MSLENKISCSLAALVCTLFRVSTIWINYVGKGGGCFSLGNAEDDDLENVLGKVWRGPHTVNVHVLQHRPQHRPEYGMCRIQIRFSRAH
jgi:hypothetical protein